MAKISIQKPVRKSKAEKKSSGKGWISILLLIALGGGGYYGYDIWRQKKIEQEAAEALRRSRLDADKQLAEEMARLAAEREEQDRLAAEEEERRRLAAEEEERRRKAAEAEAERLRKMKEAENAAKKDDAGPQEPPAEEPKQTDNAALYEQSAPLHGTGTTDVSTRKKHNEMLNLLLEKKDFDTYEQVMSAKVKEAITEYTGNGRLSYGHYKNHPNLVQTVELCLLIRMAGAKAVAELASEKGNEVDNRGTDFLRWALLNRTRPLHLFMQSYIYQGGRPENMEHSLRLFYTMWAEIEAPAERTEYLNLLIAGSLMRPEVCNARGSYRDDRMPILTVPEVCAYLRKMDKKRKLVTDIKKLSVSQLIHVVDVRLPQCEIDWAEENTHYKQAGWGAAYDSIRYLMERAANDKDPYQLYSFEELRKEGGVCRDQGYFACNTGKCRGVPAVYIVGDGDRGPHAWMVHLTDNVKWTQTNSYGYNSGTFVNPCSGLRQHESVLLNRNDKTTDDKLVPAADAMVLAEYLMRLGCAKEAHDTARFVTTSFPLETASWAHYIHVLEHDGDTLPGAGTWRKIYADLVRLSKKNYELLMLATEIEGKYLLKGRNAASRSMAMQRTLSQLNKRGGDERADLVLQTINQQADALVEAKNLLGLTTFYRKQLKKYADRGDVFEKLIRQYMNHLGEEATPKVWNIMARDAEKIYERSVKSGGGDFFKLQKEVEIQKMIAEAWEKAGNTRKAEKHRKTAEERLNNAKERYKSDDDDED